MTKASALFSRAQDFLSSIFHAACLAFSPRAGDELTRFLHHKFTLTPKIDPGEYRVPRRRRAQLLPNDPVCVLCYTSGPAVRKQSSHYAVSRRQVRSFGPGSRTGYGEEAADCICVLACLRVRVRSCFFSPSRRCKMDLIPRRAALWQMLARSGGSSHRQVINHIDRPL